MNQKHLHADRTGSCLIISGGAYTPCPAGPWAYVIACDRGWEYAARYGLAPDLAVGDFDSAPPPEGVPLLRLPTRKDDTDTMAAVRRALDLGFRDIAIACALGGRLDHAFANIQTAAFAANRGAAVRLYGPDTEIRVFRDSGQDFPRRAGWSMSVFALSDVCEGVCVRGTQYEAETVTLTGDFPLGVSNVWTAETASVSAERGVLMVVQSRLRQGEHI